MAYSRNGWRGISKERKIENEVREGDRARQWTIIV